MIVTRISGGLGNQMFEYAFGLYLAKKHQTDLFLDCSWFEEDTLREFVLDRFSITAPLAPPSVRKRFIRRYGGRGWPGYLHGCPPMHRLKERVYGFREEHLDAPDDTFLDGYWQTEKCFPGMIDELRDEFQLTIPISDESLAVARQMAHPQSASLHVRRTDYLGVWYTTACSNVYYQRSVDYLLSRHQGIRLFVFSDDPEWCRKELRFPCPTTLVTHNDSSTGHEDLWLMSQCRHHVVANSTFSWWGARLGDPSGETLAPDPWFSHPTMDGSHIVPPSWRPISGAFADERAA